MDLNERDDVLNWLSGLTDHQFVELFYSARKKREESARQPLRERFAIMYLELADDEGWAYDAIAPAIIDDLTSTTSATDQFERMGHCEHCQIPWVSWSDTPECPVCGRSL